MSPSRPPLVVVNALGQGPGFWGRLTETTPSRPVLVQNARGRELDGRVTGLDDHVADLAAAVARLDVPVHLLGWCTGAKVVLRYAARLPDRVLSVTLLSPSLRHPGRPPELDTDYERELDAFCRMLVARPAAADRVRRLLTRMSFGGGPASSASDPLLDDERRRPFTTAESVTVYARQLVEFWSHDPTEDARQVSAPVLTISGTGDPIVSGHAQQPVLRLVPALEHHEVAGGGHYLMHDEAALVTALLDPFLRGRDRRVPSGVI